MVGKAMQLTKLQAEASRGTQYIFRRDMEKSIQITPIGISLAEYARNKHPSTSVISRGLTHLY